VGLVGTLLPAIAEGVDEPSNVCNFWGVVGASPGQDGNRDLNHWLFSAALCSGMLFRSHKTGTTRSRLHRASEFPSIQGESFTVKQALFAFNQELHENATRQFFSEDFDQVFASL
jgi:hypothetical protein